MHLILSLTGATAPHLQTALNTECINYIRMAYAPNTNKSYKTHRRSYLAFCAVMGYAPVPATTGTLCQYASLLARTLKYTSIKQYLNAIRILHQEWGLPNPMMDNYQLRCVLRGVRRQLGDTPSRKAPITPSMLIRFLSNLNLHVMEDRAMWAVMLLLMFGMLRVASVLCASPHCDHTRHLLLKDVTLHAAGVNVTVRHTKTIQYKERTLSLPLPRVPGNVLCPSQALALYLHSAPAHPNGPVFYRSNGSGARPLTTRDFNSRIKALVTKAGLETSSYAGHSFRRGGACLAYQLGTPVDTIRQIGDWASNAYTAYILPERPLISRAINNMVIGANHR